MQGKKKTPRLSRGRQSGVSAVGSADEGVNKLQNEKSEVPSSAEEGWMRDEIRICEATKIRADGVVLVKFHHIF